MVYAEIINKMMEYTSKKTFHVVLKNIKVLSAKNGSLEAEMKVEEQHSNVFGTLHGGYSATLIDVMSGYAMLTHPKYVDQIDSYPNSGVSVDLHISFLRPAKIGEEILIKANTVKAGKLLAFLEIAICNKKSGDTLVTATHTKYVG